MTTAETLLERAKVWKRLQDLVDDAVAGRGALLLVEADPGEGKTALLRELVASAAGRMQVRSALGSELEQSHPWGIARQLLSCQVVREVPADDPVANCFALTETCAEMAEGAPMLVVVDDAHWADPLSARWLVHLASRLSDMPVAVVVASRRHDPRRPAELTVLGGLDAVESHGLAPLTAESTAALVRRWLKEADETVCHACYQATAGNAFLTVELAKELQVIAASGAATDPDAIAGLAIDRVDRVVARRLVAAGGDAAALARAASVCGPLAPVADVAAVARLGPLETEVATQALRGAGLLDDHSGRLDFAHPLLRSAVERSLPTGERTALHLRAARRLDEQGEGAERVASHLLMAEPGNDPWVRRALVRAADAALASGAPRQAVALYQRALAERTGRDPGLLLALGRAAMGIEPAAAEAPLREAMEASKLHAKVEVAMDLAVVLQSQRRFKDIVALLEPLGAELEARDHPRGARLRVEAELLAQSFFDNDSRPARALRLEHAASQVRGEDPEEALILVQLAIRSINHGTATETLDLVDQAWADGGLAGLVGTGVSPALQWIPYLYMYVDRPDKALAIADQWRSEGRNRGSAVLACFSEAIRAEALRRMGSLVDALGAAEVAWHIAAEIGRDFPGWWISSAAVAQELVATGDADRAVEFLESLGLLDGPPPEIMLLPCPRVARAEALTAAGRTEQGVSELLAAWHWIEALDELSPGAWHFPALLVDGLLFLDRRQEAADIANQWLVRTAAFGAASTLGMAQRAVALTQSGEGQIAGLAQAERTLAAGPSASEHARALVELGSALRRAGRRVDARDPLRRGLDQADRCGAKALAARALEALTATGARPRRTALTGIDSLSGGERRVAQLAASGLTNREIAATLFLSRKTVEHHLGSIYIKLGTNDRSRLADIMSG